MQQDEVSRGGPDKCISLCPFAWNGLDDEAYRAETQHLAAATPFLRVGIPDPDLVKGTSDASKVTGADRVDKSFIGLNEADVAVADVSFVRVVVDHELVLDWETVDVVSCGRVRD